jgi:glycosyltransferase involved in cell wall biosynthesis
MAKPLLVVVPALNEEAAVGDVVRGIRAQLGADVLVVDDGSTDRTHLVAAAAGAHVLRHPYNLGVGAALRSGFRFAVDGGYDRMLQIDGDGQHDVDVARSLVAALEVDDLDLVIGSRFDAGYKVGLVRRTVMRFLSRVVSRHLGVTVRDTTSGFRAFGPKAMSRFAVAYPSTYLSDTVEALLLAGDWGLRVAEHPVRMRARTTGKPSAGPLKSAVLLLRLLLVVVLHRVRSPMIAQEAIDVPA